MKITEFKFQEFPDMTNLKVNVNTSIYFYFPYNQRKEVKYKTKHMLFGFPVWGLVTCQERGVGEGGAIRVRERKATDEKQQIQDLTGIRNRQTESKKKSYFPSLNSGSWQDQKKLMATSW